MHATTKLFPEVNEDLAAQIIAAPKFEEGNRASVLTGSVVVSTNGFSYSNALEGTHISCYHHNHGFSFTIKIRFVSISYLEKHKEFIYKKDSPSSDPDFSVIITPTEALDHSTARIFRDDELFEVAIEESTDPSEFPEELARLELIVRKGRLIWPLGEFQGSSGIQRSLVGQVAQEYLEYRKTFDDQIRKLLGIQGKLIERENNIK